MNRQLFLAALMTLTVQANAQTSTTTVSAPATQESVLKTDSVLQNKKFEDNKEITDSKLKAEGGSFSRYSLKVSLNFSGPPVGDLSNKRQPNPDGNIGNSETSLGGSLSARYRLDSKSALSTGTGVSALTPFHGVERVDVRNPFLRYDRSSRLGEVQIRNSYDVSLNTNPAFQKVGQTSGVGYDNSVVYNIGTSGFAVGLDSSISAFIYDRGYEKSDRTASRYYVGFYPQVKYNFSDKVNMYNSFAFGFANPRARDSEFDLLNKTVSGRLGMGMAFTKDIYFAPFLNYYPENLRTESTTFSFSTIFSIL
ncbi:hypothetical protein [Bdellovibrio reynosensis]|uniref:Uncharacterized protein n=1 Tax=Bdellovibrio reynosensis TaxID=2835041 RepID=A0ABY4C4E4_9BACT|nr:hypothetical protein [Bdellovibrio reynosensis]UOE99831.1 hypothetical protein MNR06_08995 [Bdellovibrio reynosensis]